MTVKIYLISRPQFEVDNFLMFLSESEENSWKRTSEATPPEEIVEVSGRICYMSFGKRQSPRTNSEYIKNLIRQGHESVLEHINWTFLLTGVSRGFTHQLVRHRVGFAYSQLSQQYHQETDANFVEPSHLSFSPKALDAWQQAITITKQAYQTIINELDNLEMTNNLGDEFNKKEISRALNSAARSVLPNAIETQIMITANARALRHFFKVRGSIVGDEEMRNVASELLGHLKQDAPSVFSDFEIDTLSDGSSIVVHQPL
jgi:thymidylate synthase (FAD)